MHFPLTVSLRPARGVLAPVLAAHAAAALALFHAATLPAAATAAGCGVIGLSLLAALRDEFAKRALVLVLREDGGLVLECAGRVEIFRVAATAVDFGWAAWLPLCRDELPAGRVRRRLMLVPGNLPPAHWRAFRTWLRHKAQQAAA